MAQALRLDLGCAPEDADSPLPVLAPPQEIGEILGNLIHNALRHAPRGGTVTVSAGRDGPVGFVDVVDNGPGIAPERREAVFERFHSRSQAGAPGTAGAGLGLAIARAYARKRGGDVTLHDAPHGPGLRARLQLPIVR
jgi:two-component system sensor histidine kinase TctE